MKKKIANGIELLLLIVSFILLNIKCLTVLITTPTGFQFQHETSHLDWFFRESSLQTIPMCLWFLLCAVMCVISIFSKNEYKDGKAHPVLAILLFISVNYNIISMTSGNDILANNFPGIFFEIILFLAVVVAFAKRSSIIAETPNKNRGNENVIKEITDADELKKYKDLLDSGAITQEEFEEKKKQLLNL